MAAGLGVVVRDKCQVYYPAIAAAESGRDHPGMLTRRALLKIAGAAGGALIASVFTSLSDTRKRVRRASAESPALRYDPTRRYEIRIHDVEYLRVEGESLRVRIYEPRGPGPFPLLMDVHAGVWGLLDRTHSASLDEVIATSGAVVAAIDYRLAPLHPYPASVVDVNYATRWLRAHAGDFNAAPTDLGGIGASAGGHLLMLSAMRPDEPRYAVIPLTAAPEIDATVAYTILLSPILDPYARYLFAKKTGRNDLVGLTENYFRTVQAMREGNPQELLSSSAHVSLPRTLILQGTADTNVTVEMQERFATAYRAVGGTVNVEIFRDAPHIFALTPSAATDRAHQLTKAFIAEHWRPT